jgi:hypothetical protein
MHAFRQTLLQVGDLSLLVIPGATGPDCYCVAVGSTPLATFPTVERALAFFDALRAAGEANATEAAIADAWAQEAEHQRLRLEGAHRPTLAPGQVTNLATYRRRRAARRVPPKPTRPST